MVMEQPWMARLVYSTLSTANLAEAQAGAAAPSPSNSDNEAKFMQGIQRATALQRKAVTRTTQQMRDKALQEFSNWLAVRVQHRNVHSCTPEDFAVYLTMHWMEVHAGTGAAGSQGPAPVSVSTMISHLTMELDKLGRLGYWDPDTGKGKRTTTWAPRRPGAACWDREKREGLRFLAHRG